MDDSYTLTSLSRHFVCKFWSFFMACTALVASGPQAFGLSATPSTTEGPYYTMSSANNADKSHFTGEGIDNDLTHITSSSTQCNGTIMILSGKLLNTSGTAISGATIELWEADNGGIYWYTSSSSTTNAYANRDKNFQGYGKCVTGTDGSWSFRTIKPGLYVGRIRHFHLKVRINGTELLTSQFMFNEDSGSFSSDNVASPLVSAGTMSLVTITPSSGTDSAGNTVQLASKDIVISYAVAATAPSIATQPASVAATVGDSVSFTVAASGTAPLSYQWYKNEVSLSGATSATYSISSVATTDAGNFKVIVTNSSGSATSSVAVLTVSTLPLPVITVQPTPAAIATGGAKTFSVTATSTTAATYQWYKDGAAIDGAVTSTYAIAGAGSADAGLYRVDVTNSGGTLSSDVVNLLVTPATSTGHRLRNLSARGYIPGADVKLIAGFVVQGNDGKKVLVRAVGPTLSTFEVSGYVTDPSLALFNASSSQIAANEDWNSSLSTTFSEAGAFALPEGSKDAALVVDLPQGNATAQVTSSTAGIALVEAYETDTTTTAKLINLSTRAFIGTGSSVLIAGFAIEGSGGKTLLLRGVGPGLSGFSITDYLADPVIDVYNAAGTKIAANDDWSSDLSTTFSTVGAFALTTGSTDAALLVTLPAGSTYTAVIHGKNEATGEAIAEVYEVQ